MFFSKDCHVFEIVGVFRGVRERFKKSSFERSYSSIGIRLSGKSEITCNGERIIVKEDQLLYIPSLLKYSQKSVRDEFISVCFIEHGEGARGIELLSLSDAGKIRDMLIDLHAVWTARARGYRMECQAILCKILKEAYLSSSKTDNTSTRAFEILKPAVDYIYSSYKSQDICISHLAGLCYISETYFRRLFNTVFGTSPSAFIKTLRIDTAASLLEGGDFSVSDAAMAVGFWDVKYFSREFKRIKGVSPKNYPMTR